jgi:osmotically-inducible protein OsmY
MCTCPKASELCTGVCGITSAVEKKMKATILILLLLSMGNYPRYSNAQNTNERESATMGLVGTSQSGIDQTANEVRYKLMTLSSYSVFDWLKYGVSPNGTVTLWGDVTRLSLKQEAQESVHRIRGVKDVNNQIVVLPMHRTDERIRRTTFRKIYGHHALSQYQFRAFSPIHIVVECGHVTLEGTVAAQRDKEMAEAETKGVPGVYGVLNNLRVESE